MPIIKKMIWLRASQIIIIELLRMQHNYFVFEVEILLVKSLSDCYMYCIRYSYYVEQQSLRESQCIVFAHSKSADSETKRINLCTLIIYIFFMLFSNQMMIIQ